MAGGPDSVGVALRASVTATVGHWTGSGGSSPASCRNTLVLGGAQRQHQQLLLTRRTRPRRDPAHTPDDGRFRAVHTALQDAMAARMIHRRVRSPGA